MRRNVLITGSSRGIGAAMALAFAENGDNVGIVYYDASQAADEIAKKAREFGVEAKVYKTDVRSKDQCKKMIKGFIEDFQTIDVLINNAGGGLKIPEGGFEEMPLEYWDSMINLNLSSSAYCSHYAVKNMIENNVKGKIINISSVHSIVTYVKRKTFPYCAAKAGLNMFTKTLAVEMIKHGINVNGIAPGFIQTRATTRYNPKEMEAFLRKIPAGFLGKVEDITPLALFLADSQASRFIVGQTFVVDGGQSIDGTIDYMLGHESSLCF